MNEMQEWVWQGFYGPKSAVTTAKTITDQDMRAGAWVPVQADPALVGRLVGA